MAERYQLPVIFLSDQSLTARVESVDRSNFQPIEVVERAQVKANGANGVNGNGHSNGHSASIGDLAEVGAEEHEYARYAYTASGISPMTTPGHGVPTYVATGLEHDEHGHPDYEPEDHTAMMEKRFRKLDTAAEELPQPQRYGAADATIGIIGWGSTEGTIQEAVDRAQAKGFKVAALHTQILFPLPHPANSELIPYVNTGILPQRNYFRRHGDPLAADN